MMEKKRGMEAYQKQEKGFRPETLTVPKGGGREYGVGPKKGLYGINNEVQTAEVSDRKRI